MADYPRKDGGSVNTDYRGQPVKLDVAKDNTIFVRPTKSK